MDAPEARAHELDAADPLADVRDAFLPPDPGVVAYLDGNSLGRPPRVAAEALERFVGEEWGGRLIRGWDEGWMELPTALGDRLGRTVLGAAPGQVVLGDSTSVLLYKLARAAVAARPGRRVVVLDAGDFPTDRYVLEGIAAERELGLRWLDSAPDAGPELAEIEAALDADVALLVLSHVAYRSAQIADAAAITRAAQAAGALVLWDLSHSAGVVPVALDAWAADLAVGCTYKYLNGGPGAPAFAYVRSEHADALCQPVWGWMGREDVFGMGPGYSPTPGIRSFLSGTPPILALVPLAAGLGLIEAAGIDALRAKSVALTEWAIELFDAWLAPRGVALASPRDAARRGGHVTVRRAGFAELLGPLRARGVIPDYRAPDGLRLGLSPLTTSFAEVHAGLAVLRELLG